MAGPCRSVAAISHSEQAGHHDGGRSRRAGIATFRRSSSIRAASRPSPASRSCACGFTRPVPLAEGFARIEQTIRAAGRPLTAFCACELRSPAPFTEDGFRAFNEIYAGTLRQWGVMTGDTNPVARSNVCPEIDPPAEPSFHAFCYTVPAQGPMPTFVVAGSGEARRRQGQLSRSHGAARRDFARRDRARRRATCSARWSGGSPRSASPGPTRRRRQVYTVHDLYPFLADEIVRRGAARAGLTWHYARPPVRELEYEMDCRGIVDERVIV